MVCVSESNDFQVAPTSIHVTPTTPAIVQVTFTRDNIAQEPNKTVRLRFTPQFTSPIGEILLDTIDITVIDTDSKLYIGDTRKHKIMEQQNNRIKKLCICAKYTSDAPLPRLVL